MIFVTRWSRDVVFDTRRWSRDMVFDTRWSRDMVFVTRRWSSIMVFVPRDGLRAACCCRCGHGHRWQ